MSLKSGLAFTLILSVGGPAVHAATNAEYRELYRSARAQAMGNAFTGVADDEFALFYNPAGLAGLKKSSFTPGVIQLELSTQAISMIEETASTFSEIDSDTINTLMGKNIHARGNFSTIFSMPNFAVAYFYDQQVAIRAENPALPDTDFGYQTTQGIQAGFGFSLIPQKARTKTDFRIGVALKVLWRKGGYQQLPLSTLLSLNKDSLNQITGGFERGYTGDVGMQYIQRVNDRLSFQMGSVVTELGDLTFGGKAQTQPMTWHAGTAMILEAPWARTILSYDIRHIARSGDFSKKQHFGLEVKLPVFSIQAGLSQLLPTYGASVDLWLVRLTGLSYASELGTFSSQDRERRYMLSAGVHFVF